MALIIPLNNRTALTLQAGSNTSFEAVPIGVMIAGGVATYSLSPSYEVFDLFAPFEDPDTINVDIYISRSTTTKFFAIVLGIVMWCVI
jgi:hypothetical protein